MGKLFIMKHEHVFKDETNRYSRQVQFKPIRENGLEKIKAGRVLVVGCGGIGSISSEILARAGVGYLRLVDRDYLILSDLQCQMLFDENDVREGLPKAIAAKRKLRKFNSTVKTEAHVQDVNRNTIEELTADIDLVMDGTDNFRTHYLINEICVKNKIPWIYGDCSGATGETMTVIPGITPCFQCVFKTDNKAEKSRRSENEGIIAPAVSVIASIQCAEALKILSGNRDNINKVMYSIHLWENEFQVIDVAESRQRRDCPVCDYHQFNYLNGKYGTTYASLIGNNAIQLIPFESSEINLMEAAIELSTHGDPLYNEFVLRLKIDEYEIALFRDGRAIIRGTSDVAIAQDLYANYIEN
ncbi:thiazole biosynthesis adenylyltransferase ThiF [candidate division KSB1 bacterium]|nr:thiazole biosynthesis adenylyltransferase ThiF [candidate division KSB1 bacterium]